MEIYNGYSINKFNELFRAWLTLVGRGFTPTATAVSDTHKKYKAVSGGPRSWVYMGEETQLEREEGEGRPPLDEEAFAIAINQGRLSGSNGPLLSMYVELGDQRVTLGDTLSVTEALTQLREDQGEEAAVEVTIIVEARCPSWMELTDAQLFINISEGLDLEPGTFNNDPVSPTQSQDMSLRVEGDERGPQHPQERVYEARFTQLINQDSYVVATIRGSSPMFPVIHRGQVQPFAYTNPVYIDADGGGYQNPPLASLAESPRPKSDSKSDSKNISKIDSLLEHLRHHH